VTRLPLPDPASLSEELRTFLSTSPPDPMVRMLAVSQSTVQPFVRFARVLFITLELSARSRELVVLTVAALTEAVFVQAQHEGMAAGAGVEPRVRELIAARQVDSPELSASDRAIVRFVAEAILLPRVSDAVFGEARRFLSDRQLVEAVQVLGYYWTFGRISTTFDVEVTEVYGGDELDDVPGDA
jgi:alkylhydroperoxidase family enzyme